MNSTKLKDFATRYTAAWCSQNAASVAEHAVFRWTLTGTNIGPGGTGKAVRISGQEEWTIGADGLIAESKGHFDEADYQRQLNAGVGRKPQPSE